jgi:hypothetical protein
VSGDGELDAVALGEFLVTPTEYEIRSRTAAPTGDCEGHPTKGTHCDMSTFGAMLETWQRSSLRG